ncbi:hypothetical protein BGZ76_003239, partial [Entomortierella beljakovae]
MRRYRRGGGSVASFALESFITMPSDKDVYNQILDGWRSTTITSNLDVIVLDQDMKAGEEEYGRSATAAWTLLNVLERGGGNNCFSGASINLCYLEGGFESFQDWDSNGKYLERPGSFDSQTVPSMDLDVEMTLATPSEAAAPSLSKRPSLSINTSVVFEPKQRTPVRRESLFSLNTKSLQRPAGLSRSQTVNLKPLIIPSPNNTANTLQPQPNQQQPKGSWLTVPASTGACALSPTMSIVSNHSMEISHSASTDHSSTWSADSSSINGSGHFPPAGLGMSLTTKRSMSSLLTINSANAMSSTSIQEEQEEECTQSGSGSRWSEESLKDAHHTGNDSFVSQTSDSHTGDEEVDEDASEKEISCILPGFLYLGPEILHQHQVDELDRLGVKRIVNMAKECEDALVCNRQGMEYHKIGVYDHIEADVQAGLLEAVDII